MNGKNKLSLEELCSQPVDPNDDSWEEQLPDFAKECNYCLEAAKYRRG